MKLEYPNSPAIIRGYDKS